MGEDGLAKKMLGAVRQFLRRSRYLQPNRGLPRAKARAGLGGDDGGRWER
jgi:hypothetical protein